MTKPTCDRCGLSEQRLFQISMREHGKIDLVRVDIRLCHACAPVMANYLRELVKEQGGEA